MKKQLSILGLILSFVWFLYTVAPLAIRQAMEQYDLLMGGAVFPLLGMVVSGICLMLLPEKKSRS